MIIVGQAILMVWAYCEYSADNVELCNAACNRQIVDISLL